MTKTLHLGHLSMQFSDSENANAHDLDVILGIGFDALSVTEFGDFHRNGVAAAREHGYRLVHPKGSNGRHVGSAWFLNEKMRLMDAAWLQVVPAVSGPAREGGHGARGILTADCRFMGEEVSLSTGHLVTAGGDPGRRREQIEHAQAMARQVARNARGYDLAFFSGDLNDDDQVGLTPEQSVNNVFASSGLVTVWDELGKHPGTLVHRGSRTIDVVGSFRRDRRVVAKAARVYTDSEITLRTDHLLVSAWYQILGR
jgi:hypothetical protein